MAGQYFYLVRNEHPFYIMFSCHFNKQYDICTFRYLQYIHYCNYQNEFSDCNDYCKLLLAIYKK